MSIIVYVSCMFINNNRIVVSWKYSENVCFSHETIFKLHTHTHTHTRARARDYNVTTK